MEPRRWGGVKINRFQNRTNGIPRLQHSDWALLCVRCWRGMGGYGHCSPRPCLWSPLPPHPPHSDSFFWTASLSLIEWIYVEGSWGGWYPRWKTCLERWWGPFSPPEFWMQIRQTRPAQPGAGRVLGVVYLCSHFDPSPSNYSYPGPLGGLHHRRSASQP